MSLHHRAIISAYSYSRTLGFNVLREQQDIGFEWGTRWEDDPRVANEVDRLQRLHTKVVVDTRDVG
jgi:hypothetical protein